MSILQEMLAILEGEVIKAKFGKARGVERDTGIEIPPGYDRFEVDGKKIIGIKGGKKTVVSNTSDERLARELVKVYNNDGKSDSGIQKLTMMQAFGSKPENILADAGIKLTEKPSYWDEFEGDGPAAKRNISEIQLKRIEKLLGKLEVFTGQQVFGISAKPRGPLASVKMELDDIGDIAIIKFDDGTRYLISTGGANTYIRNWQKIV